MFTIPIYPAEHSCLHSYPASIHHGTNRIPKAQNAKVLPAKGGHARELQGRLEAREEWGDDGNDAHDRRIEMLRERDEALDHGIAHAKGEYEYQTEGIQDIDPDLRRELEIENDERWGYNEAVEGDRDERQDGNDEREDEQEENSDMEIESDSD